MHVGECTVSFSDSATGEVPCSQCLHSDDGIACDDCTARRTSSAGCTAGSAKDCTAGGVSSTAGGCASRGGTLCASGDAKGEGPAGVAA